MDLVGVQVAPEEDPFRPPEHAVRVSCLHCGEEYDSSRIEWRRKEVAPGRFHSFWCCPVQGCDGAGFGFDILPTDPNYRDERGGWVCDDEDEWPDEEWPDEAESGCPESAGPTTDP